MEPLSHTPVLYHEVLQGLMVKPGGQYIDATLGAGGHAAGILETAGPQAQLLGIDLDPQMLEIARKNLAHFPGQTTLVQGNFRDLASIAGENGVRSVDGILFDLGVSGVQLEARERGFSFLREGPLDMRFSPQHEDTAAELINHLSEKELADLIWEYGEERRSRSIARAILRHRPIKTTTQLAEIVARAVGRRGRIHPATRTFQALRIVVNAELSSLAEAMPQAVDILSPGGRLVMISFHSLEDRMVKNFLRQEPRLEVLTRKPIQASRQEIHSNPRSRSAKMRIGQRIS